MSSLVDPRADVRRFGWAVPLLVAAVAIAWFWPVLGHGLRSDDYLTVYYLDREAGAVRWGRVFQEFVRPWFGADDLYRPLVSLSFGLEFAVGGSAALQHLTNILCLAVTVAATAATAARLTGTRRSVAALVAGLAVALHPSAVEPTAWICGRTTGLQMAAVTLAIWCHTRWSTGVGRRWPALALFAVALGCKEGAVILPGYVLAIDVWLHGWRGWRARAARLLPFVVVLVVYFALRLAVLGKLGGGADGAGPTGPLASATNVATRVGQLLVPPDGAGVHRWWAIPCVGLALLGLAFGSASTRPATGRQAVARAATAVLALAGLAGALLLPSHHMTAAADVLYGRLVFDAVPGLALVLALAVAAARLRWLALQVVAVAAWLLAMALTSAQWLDRYAGEDRVARAAQAAVVAAGTTNLAQPLGIANMPCLPVLHYKLWGVLGLAPFAPRDLAIAGFPEFQFADEHAPQFFNDPAALYAFQAAGGGFSVFTGDRLAQAPAPPHAALTLAADPAQPGDFLVPEPWPGTSFAAVEVRAGAGVQAGVLRLLADFPEPRAFGSHTAHAADGTLWFDTTHAMAPVMLASVGVPFRGLHLDLDGHPAAPSTTVVVHALLPRGPTVARCAGAPRSRAELFAILRHPPVADVPLRCYLVLPTGVRHQDVPAGGADAEPALVDHLRYAADLYAPVTAWWFWQTAVDAPGAPWSTALDWAVVR